VELEFDPAQLSYAELLQIFWDNHDPTTLNRQGPDVGDQYRSAIFCHGSEQEKEARASMERMNREKYHGKIVTQIVPEAVFWKAEEYHQQYLKKRGLDNCHI